MPRTTFVCTYENCSCTFQHMERYENHLRTHSGERPFICTYDNCEKSYRRLSHLKRHEDTQHGSMYNCTVSGCAKILKSKATLKKHINIVHMNKQPKKYKCTVCNDEFSKHVTLQKHSFIHTGEKPFLCPETGCNKSFFFPCKLKQHLKCHKGYICDEPDCKKQFPRWSLLVNHRRQSHPRVHKCPVCRRKFSFLSNFKTHCSTHAEEREVFKCPVPNCIKFYQAKRYLSKHMNNFHKKRPISCSENDCHKFFKTEEEKAKHFKCHHQPKQKKQKPLLRPRPFFANILAGFEKGTKKDLNPQHLQTLPTDNLNEEPAVSTEMCHSEDNTRNSFDGEMSTCSTELLKENNWTCTDSTMGQVMS